MDGIEKLILSKEPKNQILSYFESISSVYDDIEDLNREIMKIFEDPSLAIAYKIVYAATISESIDENLYNIGIKFLDRQLHQISKETEICFFDTFHTWPIEIKKFALCTVCTNSHLVKCDLEFLQQLYDIAQYLSKVNIDTNDQCSIFRDVRFRSFQKEGNCIKDAIKLSNENCDYINILKMFALNINPYSICDILIMLAGPNQDSVSECIKFLNALKETSPNFKFHSIYEGLFYLHDLNLNDKLIKILVISYEKIFGPRFPIDFLYKYNSHKDIVYVFVKFALENPDVLSFTNIKHTEVNLKSVFTTNVVVPSNWGSLEFISLLLDLYKYFPQDIDTIFESTIPNYVDFLYIGILQQPNIKITNSIEKIIHKFTLFYISCEKSSSEVLKYAWNCQNNIENLRKSINTCILEYFNSTSYDSTTRITRILDIAQNLKAVGHLLNNEDLSFVIEIAIIAKKRNYVQLDKWLNEKLSKHSDKLLVALLTYVKKNFHTLINDDNSNEIFKIHDNSEILDDIIFFLSKNKNLLNNEEAVKLVEHIFSNYQQKIDACMMIHKPENENLEKMGNFFTQYLQLANSQSTFDDKVVQLDDFLKALINIPANDNGKSDFYLKSVIQSSMNIEYYKYLTNLDLNSVAVSINRLMLAGCIESQVILELIDNLLSNNPALSRYFFMAISIISCNPNILLTLPELCTKWFKSSFFSHFPPFIRFSIEYVHYKNALPLNDQGQMLFHDPYEAASKMPTFITDMLRRVETDNHFLNSKNELLMYQPLQISNDPYYKADLSENILQPHAEIKNIALRIIYNLCEENLVESTMELKQCLNIEDYDWLAYYLIHEKICLNSNLHQLYFKMIKIFNNLEFYNKVRSETNHYIASLLSQLRDDSQHYERNLLYCLGSWFGMITIGDNKPLTFKEINIKMLIVEAAFKGQDDISRILPFIKNFMASIKTSYIFSSSNPWVIGVSAILAEIYSKPDLRQSIRFEIETVVHIFDVNFKSIYPSLYLAIPETISRIKLYLPWTENEINCFTFKLTINSEKYLTYERLDVSTLNCIIEYIKLSTCPEEFHKCIGDAFMVTIKEISVWMMDKVGTPVTNVVETAVQQDFRRDSEDNRSIYAAHAMSKSLSVAYAGILLKGTYFTEICGRLKNSVEASIKKELEVLKRTYEKEKLSMLVYNACQENIEVLFCFITKSCAEKIIQAVDKKLNLDYEARRGANIEKLPFVSSYPVASLESLPERLKSKIGVPTSSQLSVYHEFNKILPGFAHDPNQLIEKYVNFNDNSEKMVLQEMSDKDKKLIYSILYQYCKKLQNIISPRSNDTDSSQFHTIVKLQEMIVRIVVTNDIKSLPSFIQNVVVTYFEFSNKYKLDQENESSSLVISEILIDILLCLRDSNIFTKYLCNLVTKSVVEFSSDSRNYTPAVNRLISNRLLLAKNFDQRLSYEMATNKGNSNIDFATELCRSLLVEESNRGIITEYDFSNILDTLTQISTIVSANEANDTQSETHTNGVSWKKSEGYSKNYDAENLLREWVRIYYSKSEVDIDTDFKIYMIILSQYGVLLNDDLFLTFFKSCLAFIVALSLQVDGMILLIRSYQIIDSYAALIAMTIKYYGGEEATLNSSKMNFFNKILNIIGTSICHDNNYRPKSFRPLMYQRILVSLILEISRSDALFENIRKHMFTCFIGFLHSINPEIFPAFTHSFLIIVSHRHLISMVLEDASLKNQLYYKTIIIDVMRFLYPFLSIDQSPIPSPVHTIYEGLVRLLLILSHDFPNFISSYYLDFSLVIPHQCIQLRNIILNVIPRGLSSTMESSQAIKTPIVNFSSSKYIPDSLLRNTDLYISKKDIGNYYSLFRPYLNETTLDIQFKNIFLITSIIYYIGTNGINDLCKSNKTISTDSIKSTIQFQMVVHLCQYSDKENQFILLTAITNNIRHSSTHTKYFSCLLLLLYLNINDESFKERLTRVLVERVICYPPYPVGLVYIITLFIKTPEYKFLKQKCFSTNNTPENLLEKIFRNLNLGKLSNK